MRKLTQEEFLNKMKMVDLTIEFLSAYTTDKGKIECRCKVCNYEWEDSASHLKQGRGCGNCKKIERRLENAKKFFATSAAVHHNKYDYSKFEYIDSYTKGIIICPEHGEFLQIPNSHIKGRGCPLCAGNNYKREVSEFSQKTQKIHGLKYDYSKVNYKTCKDKVLIICTRCGQDFWQTPDSYLLGKGCPNCKLQSLTILYERLKQSFPSDEILFEVGSSVIPRLEGQRFDIYFPKYNIAVEYMEYMEYNIILQFCILEDRLDLK